MTEINLSTSLNLAKMILEIIKKEYFMFFNEEKREFWTNLDYDNFFKYQKDAQTPIEYLSEDGFYLSQDNLNIEIIAFMCLAPFCGHLDALKTELIMVEIKRIITKYNLTSESRDTILELGPLVSEGLLKDVPFNVIFLDSNVEIFNYLVSEKGYKTANLYIEIASRLEQKVKGIQEFNPFTYLKIINDIDTTDLCECVYDFIQEKSFANHY